MKYEIIIIDIKQSSEKEKDYIINFIKSNDYSNHIDFLYDNNYVLFIKKDNKIDAYLTDIENVNYLIQSNKYDIKLISGIIEFFRYIKISKLKDGIMFI